MGLLILSEFGNRILSVHAHCIICLHAYALVEGEEHLLELVDHLEAAEESLLLLTLAVSKGSDLSWRWKGRQ